MAVQRWVGAGVILGAAMGAMLALQPAKAQAAELIPPGARYVALGSSFAAGPGIPPAEPGGPAACGRSSRNYANLVAGKLGLALTDATCSGATTANVLTTSQAGQPPQIQAVTADTRLVTMTIGGNDVNYLGSLGSYSCQDSGGSSCGAVDQAAITAGLKTVGSRIAAVIDAVRARAPQARVVVVDYQTILPVAGPLCDGVPMSDAHLAFERGLRVQLDAATRAAAADRHATLVDVATASLSHNACSAEPWIEKYVVPAGISAYHPKPAGMAAIAAMVEDRLS
ncbi:SGNH/GDSL hydrolase family protein [Kutzneria sp. NPDC052558]|uniref:SGNH/GDSL hydrolase family protein n=1 Tax=Kutzneria sp. NPDC052558 TaxID=3364121 RepID=UPI0037CC57F0